MRDKEQLIKFAQEKFNYLFDDALWGISGVYAYSSDDYDNWNNGESDIRDDIMETLRDSVKGASDIQMGATKVVFFFDEYPDICFKVPLYGHCEYRWNDWNDYDLIGVDDFTSARLFGDHEKSYDYCAVEARLYEMACERGVGDMLASTEFLCDVGRLNVYVSQRCHDDFVEYSIFNQYSHKSPCVNRLSNLFESMMSTCKINRMIRDYGIVKTYKLMKLFDEKLPTYDFHSGNFMEGDDGKIKCIDYSSFND